MIRVNLFESAGPGIYGTATARDIFCVSTMALLFCAGMALLTCGVMSALMAWK